MAAGRAFFDLRPGEGRGVLLGFLGLLGITTAHTLIETSRDALFLAKVPTTHLPALYITIAVLGIFTSRSSGARAEKKVDSVTLTMLGAAVITLLFWVLVGVPSLPTRNVLYALYVFSGMFAAQVAGQLWLRLGSIFAEHAKRLFGPIGTGAVLGAVLGSAVARGLLQVLHVRHLLLVAVFVLVVTAIGPARMLKEPPPAPKSSALDDDDGPGRRMSLGDEALAVTRHPYLVRLLLIALLAASAGTAIDFLFKRHLAATLTPAELGPYLATISLITNLASLMAQTIGVGLAIRLLDVHRALYVMPLLLAFGATGTVLGIGVFVIVLRGFDGSLRHSLHKTTTELLFVPLPDSLRARAKPIIDLMGQRGGQAVISIVILALATFLPAGRVELAVGVLVLTLVASWVVVVAGVRTRYLDVFRETLRRGRADLREEDLPPLDMSALEALIAALSSRKDAVVLGALDLLVAQGRARLIPPLVLFHPKKAIVLRALELMVESKADFVDVVDRLIVDHADAEVRAAALRARAAVNPDDEAFLRECMAAPHEEIRATALVLLIATGAIEKEEAKGILKELLKADADPQAQAALARAIAEARGESSTADANALFESTLISLTDGRRATKLLSVTETETLVHVTQAMARMRLASFGPLLFELVRERSPAAFAAVEALGAMGDVTVDLLDAALDRADEAVETKWRVINALARSTSPKAVEILARRLTATSTDTALRSRILRALRAKQSSGVVIPIAKSDLVALAENTVTFIARALAARLCHARLFEKEKKKTNELLEKSAGAELIQRLLKDKEIEGLDRLFLLLSLLYPAERLQRIQRGLESPNAKARASARELLTNILSSPLREPVLAIVDDVSDEEKLRLIGAEERKEKTYEEILMAMIAWGSELGALGAFHAGELGLADARAGKDAIEKAMQKMDASGAELVRGLSGGGDLSALVTSSTSVSAIKASSATAAGSRKELASE